MTYYEFVVFISSYFLHQTVSSLWTEYASSFYIPNSTTEKDRNEIWPKFICNFLLKCTDSENLRNSKSPPQIVNTSENYHLPTKELLKNKVKTISNLLIHFLSWKWKVHLFTTNPNSFPTTNASFNHRSKRTEEITRRFKEQQV